MKKFLGWVLVLSAFAAGAAVFVRIRYPDSRAAALVDRIWSRAQGEFAEAWEKISSQSADPAAVEDSVDSGEDDAPAAPQDGAPDAREEPAAPLSGPDAFVEANRYCGPAVASEESLRGRVVLVYVWSVDDRSSAVMLPRVEAIWSAFRHKPLAVVASHRGGRRPKVGRVLKAAKVTFPCYEGAGLSAEPRAAGGGGPFFYVVGADGRLVYSGPSDRSATRALVNAFDAAP